MVVFNIIMVLDTTQPAQQAVLDAVRTNADKFKSLRVFLRAIGSWQVEAQIDAAQFPGVLSSARGFIGVATDVKIEEVG